MSNQPPGDNPPTPAWPTPRPSPSQPTPPPPTVPSTPAPPPAPPTAPLPPGAGGPPPGQGPQGFGGPPPGGFGGPTPPPPPGGGFGGPPPGAGGPAKKGKGGLVAAILVVGVLIVGVVGFVGYTTVQNNNEKREQEEAEERARAQAERERQARVTFAEAVVAGELEAIATQAEENDELVDDTDSLTIGEDLEADLNDAGYTVVTVTLEGGTEYRLTSDPEVSAVILDEEGQAFQASSGPSPESSGEFRLIAAGPERAEGEVTLRLDEIEVRTLSIGDVSEGETVAAGATVDFEAAVEETEQYIIDISSDDVAFELLDENGATVETTPDEGNDGERFSAATSATYRVRVTASEETTFDIEVWQLAEFNWYFERPGNPDRIDPTSDFSFSEWADDGRNGLQACLFLRAGVEMTLNVSATSQDGAKGEFALLDYAIDDGDGRINEDTQLLQRLRAPAAGRSLTWTTLDETNDRNLCLRVWVENNPFPWTATATWEFTSQG